MTFFWGINRKVNLSLCLTTRILWRRIGKWIYGTVHSRPGRSTAGKEPLRGWVGPRLEFRPLSHHKICAWSSVLTPISTQLTRSLKALWWRGYTRNNRMAAQAKRVMKTAHVRKGAHCWRFHRLSCRLQTKVGFLFKNQEFPGFGTLSRPAPFRPATFRR
jgi:hypothetical protein